MKINLSGFHPGGCWQTGKIRESGAENHASRGLHGRNCHNQIFVTPGRLTGL
jgi:hypothetical protein